MMHVAKKKCEGKYRIPSYPTKGQVIPLMLSLKMDGNKLLALPISQEATLDKLRSEIDGRLVVTDVNYHFVSSQGFPIALCDEKNLRICQISNKSEECAIEIRNNIKASTSNRETLSLSCELTTTTFDTKNDLTINDLDQQTWKRIYNNTCLLRGRCFLSNGPKISDYSVIKFKPNCCPNSYKFDITSVHVELSYRQDSSQFINDKMYDMNMIMKLPFINIRLGGGYGNHQTAGASVESMTQYIYEKYPRVVHIFEPDMIELEPTFVREIDEVLTSSTTDESKYETLCAIFDKYGHAYAAKVILGGHWVCVHQEQTNEKYDAQEHKERAKIDFDLICTEASVGGDLERTTSHGGKRQIMDKNIHMNGSMTGGDPLTSSKQEWREGLRNPDTWRILEYERIEPLYKLLDKKQQQIIEAIFEKHSQQQQQQLSARSRSVPDELQFCSKEGVYKFQIDCRHRRKTSGSFFASSKRSIRFFFSPSRDRWFCKYKKQAWMPIKSSECEADCLRDIIRVLEKTNPMPPDNIMSICRFYDDIYLPNGAVAKICETAE